MNSSTHASERQSSRPPSKPAVCHDAVIEGTESAAVAQTASCAAARSQSGHVAERIDTVTNVFAKLHADRDATCPGVAATLSRSNNAAQCDPRRSHDRASGVCSALGRDSQAMPKRASASQLKMDSDGMLCRHSCVCWRVPGADNVPAQRKA